MHRRTVRPSEGRRLLPPDVLQRGLPLLILAALAALFLFPWLFLGRALLPLELLAVVPPWAQHARELWGSPPPVHNPLLDALQQYYPRRVYFTEALREGWLPFWNPMVYGGSPFLAAQQGAVLYPVGWLLALFPPERQFALSAAFHLTLAGAATCLFLRRLGLRRTAALAGGIAFAFNGFAIVWLAYPNVAQWTLAWLPAALYAWERGRAEGDLRWLAASGGALALCLLGGHAQSSAYVLLAWGGWVLFRSACEAAAARTSGRSPARAAAWLGGTLLLPLALALLAALGHLLPALDFVPRTDRGARIPWESVLAAGMPPAQLWTFLLPRLFGDGTLAFAHQFWMPTGGKAGLAFVERSCYPGVAALVLAAGASWSAWLPLPVGEGHGGAKRRAEGTASPRAHQQLALFSLGLVALALLLAWPTPLYRPLWRFAPGFGQFTAVARILCLTGWGVACLAALGVHALTAPEPERRMRAARGLAAAGGLAALLALLGHFIYGGAAPPGVAEFLARSGRPAPEALATRDLALALLWSLLPAALAGLAVRGRLRPELAGGLAAAVIAADLFAFGLPFNPRSDPALLRADTPELRALREEDRRAGGAGMPFRFLSLGPPGRELDFRARMPSNLPSLFGLDDLHGSDSFVTRRYREWEAAAVSGFRVRPGAVSLRAAGVRYYLTGAPGPPPGRRLRPLPGAESVLEDEAALPYARLHPNVQAVTRRELFELLALPNRAPVVALTAGPGAPVFDGPPIVVPFRAERRGGNRIRLEGEAPAPGLLVVCEQFDPGWKARVDGVPVRLVPADHLWLGVPVPAGRRRVELVYAPETVRVGLFGTLLGTALLVGLFVGGGGRPRLNGARGG